MMCGTCGGGSTQSYFGTQRTSARVGNEPCGSFQKMTYIGNQAPRRTFGGVGVAPSGSSYVAGTAQTSVLVCQTDVAWIMSIVDDGVAVFVPAVSEPAVSEPAVADSAKKMSKSRSK